MGETNVGSKVIQLGEITEDAIKKLKLEKYPKPLIIFDIKDVLKHVVEEEHYSADMTAEELEIKIKDIINNVSYIAFDKSQNSLQFIKTKTSPEMVVLRTSPRIRSAYVKSVYPTTFDKISIYHSKPHIRIIYVGK